MHEIHIAGRWWLCLLLLPLLAGCSGPGSGENAPCQANADCAKELTCRAKRCRKPLENGPPTALIESSPSSPKVGQQVRLDGSRSRDPDNDALTFAWKLDPPEASAATIADATQSRTSFVPDKPGDYTVTLTLSDGRNGEIAKTAVLSVTEDPNQAPVAKPGEAQKVPPGSLVVLDGSQSSDPEGESLTYTWTIQGKPPTSKATLQGPNTPNPSFTADVAGQYIISLIVTDQRSLSSAEAAVTIDAIAGWDKVPTLDKIDPNTGIAESTQTITITGSNFIEGARLLLGPQQFQTTFVSQTELTATLDLKGATPGENPLLVVNPNGKRSDPLPFNIKDIPTPEITAVNPPQGTENIKMSISVQGKGFLSTSQILFETTALDTKYVSPTELTATLDLKDVLASDYKIYVANPAGRKSKGFVFKVSRPGPAPVLTVLNPPAGVTGKKIAFSAHGIGFNPGAVLIFDGKEIPSKRVSRNELQADPHLDLTKRGSASYNVWVRNPDGQDSNRESFFVESTDPTPVLDRILPFNIYLNEISTLAIYGRRFQSNTKLFFGNKEIPATFRSSTFMEATLDTSQGSWSPGEVQATLENPGGNKSNSFKVTLGYRVPAIHTLTPGGWNTQCDADIKVYGSGFLPSSKLLFGTKTFSANPSDPKYKLTFESTNLLSFKLSKSDLSAPTTSKANIYNVTVENGPSASSNPYEFPVLGYTPGKPGILRIKPSSGAADTLAIITLEYDYLVGNFLPGATVYLNNIPQETACNLTSSSNKNYCTDLQANLRLFGQKPGTYELTVHNPCGKKSEPKPFLVTNAPTPLIQQLIPPYATTGKKFKLTVKGANFTTSSTVTWNGTALKTTFVSADEIVTEEIDTTQSNPSEISLVVDNKNGQKSTTLKYAILPPNPPLAIDAISQKQFQRGQSYQSLNITGSGFTPNTRFFFNNTALPTTYGGPILAVIPKLDLSTIAPGTYQLVAQDGTQKSNPLHLLVAPLASPILEYLTESSYRLGTTEKVSSYGLYGSNFCPASSSSSRCPSTSQPSVVLLDPNGKDLGKTAFSNPNYYPTRITGELNLIGLKQGTYLFYVQLPTGERSNPAPLVLSPPPPPVATGVSPSFSYRGQGPKTIQISGQNFTTGDYIIFNNNTLNLIPGTAVNNGQGLTGTLNFTQLKVSGDYPLYVLRCRDANCTDTQKTATITIKLQDPPCNLQDCSKLPGATEACETSSNVCLPTCTSDTTCQSLPNAPSNLKCISNLCQTPSP